MQKYLIAFYIIWVHNAQMLISKELVYFLSKFDNSTPPPPLKNSRSGQEHPILHYTACFETESKFKHEQP